MKRAILAAILNAAALTAFGAPNVDGSWEIRNVPAHFDHPGLLKIVPGEVQPFTFYFMVPEDILRTGGRVAAAGADTGGGSMTIKARRANFPLEVTMEFPEGVEFIISNAGGERHSYKTEGRTVTDTYSSHWTRLQPKRRLSEWKTYRIVVRTAPIAPTGPAEFTMTLKDSGKVVAKKTWKVQWLPPVKAAPKLKHLKFGLWDYGLHHMTVGQQGVVDLYKKVGFNCFFNQLKHIKPDPDFAQYGRFGGDLNSDSKKFPDFGPDGNLRAGSLGGLNGWYLRHNKFEDALPDLVKGFVEFGKSLRSGWVGTDYEPTGVEEGFVPGSIEDFKKLYHVSDADFERMREGLKKKNFHYRFTASDAEKKVFDKWNDWQSKLSAGFIRELVSRIRKADPGLKFFNTTLDALPCPDLKGSGLCIDASLQAKYMDMIMPQIYMEGRDVTAKYTILRVAEWKKRVNELNPKCLLHPLLIIRHSGTKLRNSPEYMRMHIIGAFAEGASGVSFYYAQQLNGFDWSALSETVRQVAEVEDFYVKGERCDGQFKVQGAPKGVGWQQQFPDGKRKVVDPAWHMTAHKLDGRVLVTLFNLSDSAELCVKVKTPRKFRKIVNGKRNADGSFTVGKTTAAFIWY